MKTHSIIFYLDPALITSSTPLDLVQYVDDMNYVLAKNSDRRLEFDPATSVIACATEPHDNTHAGPLPSEDFDVWVHAVYSGIPGYTVNGYAGMNSGGEMVLAGMKWGGVHSTYNVDYSKQVTTMLHEFAHGFGAGIGEYYSLVSVNDTSGRAPLQGIDLMNASDPFRQAHADWLNDPLLWNMGGATRDEFLGQCRFSELTSRVLNSTWRSAPQTFDSFAVQVNAGGMSAGPSRFGGPVRDVPFQVYVYALNGALLHAGQSDESGRYVVNDFGWFHHTSTLNARLVKLYQGARFVGQKWVSVYDLDLAWLRGQSECVVTIP